MSTDPRKGCVCVCVGAGAAPARGRHGPTAVPMECSLSPGRQEGPGDQELPGLDPEEVEEQGEPCRFGFWSCAQHLSPGPQEPGVTCGRLPPWETSYFIFEGLGVWVARAGGIQGITAGH